MPYIENKHQLNSSFTGAATLGAGSVAAVAIGTILARASLLTLSVCKSFCSEQPSKTTNNTEE